MTKRYYKCEETHRTFRGVKLKRCTKCKRWKEESEFNKDRARKDGLRIYCKGCDTAYGRKHYRRNRKNKKAVRDYLSYEERHRTVKGFREKLCSRCKKWKTESNFAKDRTAKDGFGCWCKECDRKRFEPNRKTTRRYLRYEERHRVVDGTKEKLCSKCGRWKRVSEFYRSRSTRDGLNGQCKKCSYKAVKKPRKKRLDVEE